MLKALALKNQRLMILRRRLFVDEGNNSTVFQYDDHSEEQVELTELSKLQLRHNLLSKLNNLFMLFAGFNQNDTDDDDDESEEVEKERKLLAMNPVPKWLKHILTQGTRLTFYQASKKWLNKRRATKLPNIFMCSDYWCGLQDSKKNNIETHQRNCHLTYRWGCALCPLKVSIHCRLLLPVCQNISVFKQACSSITIKNHLEEKVKNLTEEEIVLLQGVPIKEYITTVKNTMKTPEKKKETQNLFLIISIVTLLFYNFSDFLTFNTFII